MMDYRENAGYIITDSCHVGDSEFVLGVHLTAPQQFVTWKCTDRKDYYWGHYFSDLFSAQKDLVARAQEEVPGRTAAGRHCAGGSALFPMGERTGVRNALPRRLFRFYPRAWRRYGAAGAGGKGIPKRSDGLRFYSERLSLL